MEILDGSVISTALPEMARSFHVGVVNLNIGMTAYLLAISILIPISGWIADRYGSRSVFAAAIGIFTVASVLCGGCHTLTQFVLMRILQGVGGAMMVPVGRLIVLRIAPKDRLAEAIAYITWPGLTALVLGPPFGGFMTTYASWRWIFFFNLPLGGIAFILALLWIENIREEKKQPFDALTFLFASLASTGMVYALERLGGNNLHLKTPVLALVFSLSSGFIAAAVARRNPASSLIDIESLQFKSYALSVYGGSAFRVAVSALPFLLPLMFQITFGLSAFRSGLYLLGLFAGDLGMKGLVIQVLRRFGFRKVLIVNGVISTASMALCATFSPGTPIVVILSLLFLHGASRSLQFTAITTLAYTEILPSKMSRANGFLSGVMQFSMGMGVAVGALALRCVIHASGHTVLSPQLHDFQLAILLMSILAFGPVINGFGLPLDVGAQTSGHKQAATKGSASKRALREDSIQR